ncbi:hypothetical protein NUACC21_49070 [Scytonema sp. NUACC21]
MAILIANLGTSDLAIQLPIQGRHYYLPIDFIPNEANINKKLAKLPPNLKEIWHNQRGYIEQTLYEELGLPIGVKQPTRKFTQVLLDRYRQNSSDWHPRLKPVRLWGAIQKSISLGVNKAYLFVTNQESLEMPDGHDKDTIYLYSILEKWLKEEKLNFQLEKKVIPADVIGNELEPMLRYYYKAIAEITHAEKFNQAQLNDDLALISIKGGTGAMQTALQIQAIDSSFSKIVFIDPDLSLEKILYGQPSECQLTLYWRHLRSQRYRTVQQLLNRCDFDGAIQLLRDWQTMLASLPEGVVDRQSILSSNHVVEQVIKILTLAVYYLNLDSLGAKNLIKSSKALNEFENFLTNYDKLLNLYTQCRIYWQLNQIANFLARLGSFSEESLHYLITHLGGLKYFDKLNYPDNWYLDKSKVEPTLWRYFERSEGQKCNAKQKYRLPGRFSKWNFVSALIQYRDKIKEKDAWEKITNSLDKLDYWIEQRNYLIHSATGISQESMYKALERDKNNSGVRDYVAKACEPDQILAEITNISNQMFQILNKPVNKYIGLNDTPYYIYSDVTKLVVQKLMEDE